MGVYKLQKLGIKVGMFGNETTFLDVLNELVKFDPRLGIDSVEDLVNALSKSGYNDDMAKDLCMQELDGEDADDEEDPELNWGDQMYCRQAGKQVAIMANENSYYSRFKIFCRNLSKEMADEVIKEGPTYASSLNELDRIEKDARDDRKTPSEAASFMGLVQKSRSLVKNAALNRKTDQYDEPDD